MRIKLQNIVQVSVVMQMGTLPLEFFVLVSYVLSDFEADKSIKL